MTGHDRLVPIANRIEEAREVGDQVQPRLELVAVPFKCFDTEDYEAMSCALIKVCCRSVSPNVELRS
jgi:hypothetical protein